MNREIKFRGKDLIHNKWIYGGLAEDKDENTVILPKSNWQKGGCVDKDTIGQFIGMCDSHGNEVYEGDIIKRGEPFFSGAYIVEIKNAFDGVKFRIRNDTRFYLLPSDFIDGDWPFLVIGNIHDNPELIKEEK